MGRAAVIVGGTGCHSGVLDGLAAREPAPDEGPSGDLSADGHGTGQVLSRPAPAPAFSATEGTSTEVELGLLWFELSAEERARFGGCFSQMLVKAVKECGLSGQEEAA
jgi:hypothetical protein